MIPSEKVLEKTFPGKGKELRTLLTSNDAVLAHPASVQLEKDCYSPPPMSYMRITALNAVLEGHGVEYVQGERRNSSFEYVNMGDPYEVTIVRFNDGRYRIACWSDIVERGN